ncbi:uncharacterized protein LOC114253746 isoform X2 [Monomorium pharaonis]|uniref:uncharacterized protein LOC114253746 isoform X2 n=1 Tax=Monomorium pharaonis TaxID=307658 RepID=UPI00174756EA|nr:uncharacterized protein LOC114253746 isoform X2 [Monomorium pharaonis]
MRSNRRSESRLMAAVSGYSSTHGSAPTGTVLLNRYGQRREVNTRVNERQEKPAAALFAFVRLNYFQFVFPKQPATQYKPASFVEHLPRSCTNKVSGSVDLRCDTDESYSSFIHLEFILALFKSKIIIREIYVRKESHIFQFFS